ncbi:hypothetical protein WMW72_26135 [Paenibacillus filicis]|uniref:Uncharacterized protein n=1 Tax=Paenibacillus filicis TaxID=669464 RepID=A0ABU9DR88_9BACL
MDNDNLFVDYDDAFSWLLEQEEARQRRKPMKPWQHPDYVEPEGGEEA